MASASAGASGGGGRTSVGLPKALADFLFDLYDSVTVSQIAEEQKRLYQTEFPTLCSKYFTSSPWPPPKDVASECNGSPLFLSLYRELTYRYSCNKPSGGGGGSFRPTLHDRLEAWQVYQTVFEEILEAAPSNGLYLLPNWTFDLLHEFVYQFQGYCQLRSAVYASARKQGLLSSSGGEETIQSNFVANTVPLQNLMENLQTVQTNPQAWNVQAVYDYLYRLMALGRQDKPSPTGSYLRVFGSVVLSRLECLLADYQGCVDALDDLEQLGDMPVPGGATDASNRVETFQSIVQTCWGARISQVYHSSVANIMLQRFPAACRDLSRVCEDLLRHFKTGQLNRHEYSKPYDRMLSLLAVLEQIMPPSIFKAILDDSLKRSVSSVMSSNNNNNKNNHHNNNHGNNNNSNSNDIKDYFAAPKFISTDPNYGLYRQQLQAFSNLVHPAVAHGQLRSLLDLYHQVDLEQLQGLFQSSSKKDSTTSANADNVTAVATVVGEKELISLLLSYQLLHYNSPTSANTRYVLEEKTVHAAGSLKTTTTTGTSSAAASAAKWEDYFLQQMAQSEQVSRMVRSLDTANI